MQNKEVTNEENMNRLTDEILQKVKAELGELDRSMVEVDGIKLKPSQCYRFDVDPAHVLFNTNCPDELRKQVQSILSKYIENYEGRS
ncbi:MAG: hypothetical protein EOP48_28915 [Sphingobacteriales bacterium]|nr:MAG: hypothetical protein EOP48_28915 [Sphingobacteriales bacterium]